jgi:hypothetical protein
LMRNFWRKLFSLWSLLLLQQQHKKATTLNLSRIRDYFHRSKRKKKKRFLFFIQSAKNC